MRRRDFILAGTTAALWPTFALAQPAGQRLVAAIIGAQAPPDPSAIAWADAVRAGLAEHGWIEGQNLRFESRFTAGQMALTEAYAAEMYGLGPDVFVVGTPENAVALQALTQTIPIVFVAVSDPVAVGLVASYSRPGGNATGVTHMEPSVGGVMAELLFEIAPATRMIVYLTNPDIYTTPMLPFVEEAAAARSAGVLEVHVQSVDDVAQTIARVAEIPNVGLVLPPNNWVHNNAALFVEAINQNHIPAVYPALRMVSAGGLIGVGTETGEMFRMGGEYAGRILNGASPASLPVMAAPFSMSVNLRTAAAAGMSIPVLILATADHIIE